MKFGNRQEDHVLVASAPKLFPFKECTDIKKLKSVVIFFYF